MSVIADDVITFTSMLKMAYNLLTGNSYLKRKKFREKKKLISVALPFSDLAFAGGAIPVFPIRMEIFEINKYLVALGSAGNIFGWKSVTNLLGFIKKLDIKSINTTVDNIIDEVIDTINKKYNQMYDLGIESGISTDFCYGIKSLYGMHISKGKNVDANLNFTIRCSAWNKYLETLKTINYPAKFIWVEVPPRNIGNALDILTDNLSNAIKEIEEITHINCTDNKLRDHFRIRNRICENYKTILHEISASGFYPCNPATFAEILALLSNSFQDYNSNEKRYVENMSSLVKEMRERIRKGIGMDCSNMPRILITPMFGGWEPKSHEIIYELGGRSLYADWDMLGFLEEIPISNNSNPIEKYAHFIMNASSNYMGCDNETLTNSYLGIAKKLNVDGLVFTQLFGCHSVSNCYKLLRDKLRREEIPSTALTFNKIGENVEQVKTRLGAFMEMLK
ncbi:MAG: 2-hydroxyacyl-CoA dehydratase family protein [Candidatus Thorarchaeota archaeon]